MSRMALGCAVAVLMVTACNDEDTPATDAGAQSDASDAASNLGLPTTAADVEALIASRDYLDWICESAPRAMRGPTPHGAVRVCSNRVLSTYVDETDDWLRGSAAMKELYADINDAAPSGFSYYVKVNDESAAGAGWYWYERRGDTVTADGLGGEEIGANACVTCHAAAGSDDAHITGPGSRDFVYTAITR